MAGHLFLRGEFRHALDAHLRLRSFEQQLPPPLLSTTAGRPFWMAAAHSILSRSACGLPAASKERLREIDGSLCWNLRVPLLASDYINFTRPHESTVMPMGIGPFADVIRRTLEANIPA